MFAPSKAVAGMGIAAATMALAACGSSSGSGSGSGGSGPITIGASVSETGSLAPFATQISAGYDQAIAQVNAAGGLQVGKAKRKVKLIVLDNQSDANTAAQQIRTLVTSDSAVALLGAATPPITVPEAAAAEAERIPYVTSITPTGSWLAATKGQSHYAWDFFFDPPIAVQNEFKTADMVKTDKKIALFTDNEADGIAWGQLVEALAPKAGYSVAMHATFPVGTTDFHSFVQQAASRGADIVIAQMTPPDGITLYKQIKGLGYHPRMIFCEKCAATMAFTQATGALSDGTLTQGFWSSSEGLPDTAQVKATLGKKFPDDLDLSLAVASETAAQVLMDAISRAGSTSPTAINTAIGQTDKTYPFAHIRFGTGNVAVTPSLMEQWQNSKAVQVLPPSSSGKLQFPDAGLS
jgi:branched-chain amino acid transport system substrate-binding protein